MKEKINKLKEKIKEIIKESHYANDDGGIEIYLDYRDELSDSQLFDISCAHDAREVFNETIWEMEHDYSFENGFELTDIVIPKLSEEETQLFKENEEEMREFINENFYFYIDSSHFDKDIEVNIMLDTGNCNYDFTCDNILNYYSFGNDKIDKDSSVLWLARKFKKTTEFRKACKDINKGFPFFSNDPFITSVVEELENSTSHMATMTFLVKMTLFEYLELRDAMLKEDELNKSYIYEERTGKGYIKIGKETGCGLFNPWQGGGSLLEIELPDDLKIPIKAIFAAEIDVNKSKYGYSVTDVYGLCKSAWKKTLKEIHPMKTEV